MREMESERSTERGIDIMKETDTKEKETVNTCLHIHIMKKGKRSPRKSATHSQLQLQNRVMSSLYNVIFQTTCFSSICSFFNCRGTFQAKELSMWTLHGLLQSGRLWKMYNVQRHAQIWWSRTSQGQMSG